MYHPFLGGCGYDYLSWQRNCDPTLQSVGHFFFALNGAFCGSPGRRVLDTDAFDIVIGTDFLRRNPQVKMLSLQRP